MPSEETPRIIERKLREDLSPTHLEIADESARHAGHAGARSGGGHYAVTIVSTTFEGLDTLARHRLVYRVLAAEMRSAIHAIALSTFTPGEWTSRPEGIGSASTLP